MQVKKIEFLVSNTDVHQCPPHQFPEYAFIGRSNVGKSSLINMLTNSKVAKTSSRPGKTLLINHFFVDNAWYLVDLPGYGFAKIGKDMRGQLVEIINDYILERKELTCLFVLLDSRHEPQNIDLEFLFWLGEHAIPFNIVFTKADKLSKTQLEQNINKYKEELSQYWEPLPPIVITSSEKNMGKDELADFINHYNSK